MNKSGQGGIADTLTPRLGKGTESVQLLLSQVSKDMHQPIVPMLFPILGAHVNGAEFMFFRRKTR